MSSTKHKKKNIADKKNKQVRAEDLFDQQSSQSEEDEFQDFASLWSESVQELRLRKYSNLEEAHAALKKLVLEKLRLVEDDGRSTRMSDLLNHPEVEAILRNELEIHDS